MKKQIPSMAVLIAVCVVAVVALILVNGSTAQQAAQQEAALLTAARNSVLEADHFEKRELQESKYALNDLYAGLNASGETVGFVGSTTVSGFGGPIEVTAGVNHEGVITGIAVGGDQFNETEGLGALTRQPAFTEQFKGKKPTITLNEGGVDTVTAASTTSRAVVSGVNTVAKYIYGAELGIAEEESGPYAGQTISAAEKGFGGDVTVTVGLSADGAIEYLAIDAPNETDGLGKLASEKEFTSQFIGKKAPFAYGDGIDQLAGATFTSNAVINALNTIAEGGGEKSAEPITTTVKGFGGDVTLTVKLNPDNSIAALAIDTPNETDGLGKLASESEFTSQFIGKTAPFAYGENGIDQVTGASVTSNAVLDGLNSVVPAADGSVAPAATPEPAPEATAAPVAIGALNDGTYTTSKDTGFSTIDVEITVKDGAVADAKVTSSGANDLLTDDNRATFASQIVEKQSVDAVTGVTVSSNAINDAVSELLTQASAGAAPAEAEAPAESAALNDGTYSVDKDTDFSTIHVEMTVEGGKVTAAKVTSEGANDLLTDDSRTAFANQIVEKQVVDAVSSVTISSNAIAEAVTELLAQASAGEASVNAEAPAESAALKDGTYSVDKDTAFSTIHVEMTVEGGKVTAAKVTSEGANDLLTDDSRAAFANQIVEKQAVDAVSSVTISSNAIAEAVTELLAQASAGAAPAEAEAPAESAALKDGTYSVDKTTDFSTIHVEMTVEGGKVTAAKVTSEVKEGSVDMLTDDSRAAFANQIVEKQSVDAVSSVTISSNAIAEAVTELLAQASAGAAPAETEAPAGSAALKDGTYSVDKTTDFSTIHVEMTVEGGKVTSAKVTSEGANDLLTDDSRATFANQIVEKQAVDAVSSVTISSNAIAGAVTELLAQASAGAAPAEAEAPAGSAALNDGTYSVDKTTDFSTIHVEMTVEGGKVTSAKVTSEGANDLLTDDSRAAFANQIVEKQAVDAVSSVTISSNAIAEAVTELLAQASAGAAPAETEAPAESAALNDGTYSVDKDTDFSTIHVEMTVEGGKVTGAKVTSEGANDLLTDDSRATFAEQIVEKQAVDAVSSVTISSNAIAEAVTELLAQASAGAAPAEAEAPAGSAALKDGTYSVDKDTDFSTIHVEMTVEGGKVTSAKVTSEGANDLLTDDHRAAFAKQIVEKQAVDAVSSVTISSNAIAEAVTELLAQASGK